MVFIIAPLGEKNFVVFCFFIYGHAQGKMVIRGAIKGGWIKISIISVRGHTSTKTNTGKMVFRQILIEPTSSYLRISG